MSITDNSQQNMYNINETPQITANMKSNISGKYEKPKCQKWLMIPDNELSDYDVKSVINCTQCTDAGRIGYKHPFIIHIKDAADYICFECGEDVDVAFVCMTCRVINQSKK